ncbi:hypothetical protein OKW28_004227 [Paraburkholderia sp. 40]
MVLRWVRMVCLATYLCASAQGCLAADSSAALAAPVAPPVVYVSDFDLDAANIAPDSGPGHRARGILGDLKASFRSRFPAITWLHRSYRRSMKLLKRGRAGICRAP